MSVRIYQLAKQLGLENRKVIELLCARGLDVSSPSNTIPTIYADAFVEELRGTQRAASSKSGGGDTSAQKSEPTVTPKKPEKKEEEQVTAKSREKQPEKSPTEPSEELINASNTIVIRRSVPVPPKKPMHNPLEDIVKASRLAREHKLERMSKLKNSSEAQKQPVDKKSSDRPPVQVEEVVVHDSNEPSVVIHSSDQPKKVEDDAEAAADRPILRQFLKKLERPVKNTVLKTIEVKQPIIVRNLAEQMQIKPFQLISKLMSMSIFASMNQALEPEHAQRVAEKFGYLLDIKHRGESEEKAKPKLEKKPQAATDRVRKLDIRPPVVCVLGHVDHGKTTLLDTIRKAHVARGEAGGITQHVAAYQVEHAGKKITFIDTPGHAAFSKMRERGANITDIAILVVAADDGFMPQTDEALNFAKKANIPIIVAINKIDAKGANVDHVKTQMQQRGIMSEDWGGETLCTTISALNGTNIPDLLELVLLQAEMMELQADAGDQPSGVILESQVEIGRGPTASVIIKDGTLHVGDCIVCGTTYCKVRSLLNDCNKPIREAPPSSPVKIIGWTDIPAVGAEFYAVKNEKLARQAVEENIEAEKQAHAAVDTQDEIVDIDQLFSAMSAEEEKVLKVIVRADVQGSAEALVGCLSSIDSKKVKLEIIDSGVGALSKNDIELADTAGATIVAFNTKFENGVQSLAKNRGIHIIQHNIIYEIIDQVRDAMAELLTPELREQKLGAAEIRQIFVLRSESIAGCMVTEGKIVRDKFVRVLRKKTVLFQGKFSSLRHLKEDVMEVRAGFECGIRVSGFDDFEVGDILECFDIQKIQPSL